MKHEYIPCQLKGELERRAKFISQFFIGIQSGRLLDIGACKGDLENHLDGNIEYHSIDLNKINSKLFKKVNLNKGKVPYRNKSFDYAVCCSVIEHTFCPESIAEEITRILKPRGFAVVSLPNELSMQSRLKCIFRKSFPDIQQQYYDHHWMFDLKNSKKFLERYFTIVEATPYVGVILKNAFPVIRYFPFLYGETFFKVKKI